MRQWAVLIGLNKYQLFQPLNCAQQDAQVLHQYLIQEANFSPEQCLLLTDHSPPISGKSTQPTRENLQSWIELLVQQCFKPGDTLWFFFSGYGVCSAGRDYLVPLDGDPFAVETTCILMSDIFSRLQSSISPGLPLVLLDINRLQGTFSSENVGMQTARLAKQMAVPTVLSCQPGQYSREISSLGHGLFTIALLEALRYYQGATPATLMRFLSDRLPELGAHYYLPNQQPLPLCPADKLHQPLLQTHYSAQTNEGQSTNGRYNTSSASLSADKSVSSSEPKQVEVLSPAIASADEIDANRPQPTLLQAAPEATSTHYESAFAVNGNPSPTPLSPPFTQPPTNPNPSPTVVSPNPPPYVAPVTPPPETPPVRQADDTIESSSRLWRPVLLWGGLLSLGLIGCVIWRNWSTIMAPVPKVPEATVSAPPLPTLPTPPTVPAPNTGTTGAAAVPPGATPNPASTTQSPEALTFNPAATPTVIAGRTILETARRQVLSDQATPYRDAIDEAKRIPNNDPAYVEAQQDIANWSQRIYDISQQRAALKQWDIAIMAADLVPSDDRKLHPQARAAIAQWCPAIGSKPADTFPLQKAKAICAQQPI